MERKSKAIMNTLDKDTNLLGDKMAQSLLYQKAIIKNQEELIKKIKNKKEEMTARKESAKKQLQVYIDGKEYDEKYTELKWEYESCLEGIDSLNKSMTLCEESVAEVKLGMGRNDSL